MTSTSRPIRRVVTGHDATGRSVVTLDGPPPTEFKLDVVDVMFHELWSTRSSPCPVGNDADPTIGPVVLPPPSHGTRFRIIDIPPDSPELMRQGSEAMRQVFAHLGDDRASTASRHPAMHRTESIDYALVIDGEITLLLDADEVSLSSGDVVVQRGTNHAWANRSDRSCRLLFVLVGGHDAPELGMAEGGR